MDQPEIKSEIIHGNCLEVMKSMPSESVDLLFADPPYSISYLSCHHKYGNPFGEIKGDDKISEEWLDEAARLLKKDRFAYIFTRWDVYPAWVEAVGKRLKIKNMIVWVKNNHTAGDLEGNLAFKHELIIFAAKGDPKLYGKRDVNVWETPRVGTFSMSHPTEKPVALAQRAVAISTEPGWTVLDPFCGTGSTCVAAADLDRRAIGIEIEEKYVKVARERLTMASAQMKLF
jgi:site-specific DNA-methyltransferase (adenine-specific)